MHPTLRAKLKAEYLEINSKLPKDVRLRFAYTLRTIKEQNDLYAIGRTIKGPKVTNAKGGQSIHNYGLAFDIVFLVDKDNNGTFETASWDTLKDYDGDKIADWQEVANYFKSKGWNWGGDWTGFKDSPHFELKGYDWRTLSKLPKDKNNYPIF